MVWIDSPVSEVAMSSSPVVRPFAAWVMSVTTLMVTPSRLGVGPQ